MLWCSQGQTVSLTNPHSPESKRVSCWQTLTTHQLTPVELHVSSNNIYLFYSWLSPAQLQPLQWPQAKQQPDHL